MRHAGDIHFHHQIVGQIGVNIGPVRAFDEIAAGKVRREAIEDGARHDGASYATHFRVVCELRPGGVLASSATLIPHSFLTVSPFKRLLAFHQGMDKVLGVYEAAAQGRQTERWERLLADDYSDGSGGKEDFMRALKLRSAEERGL